MPTVVGMTTTTQTADAIAPDFGAQNGRWIDRWEPENEQFWEATGRRVARRNLIFSVFAENLGFSIWVLWTVVVISLANVRITLSLGDQFLLTALRCRTSSARFSGFRIRSR